MLHKAVQNMTLKGVAVSVRGPTISHLFFADDSLIFGRAMVKESGEWRVRRFSECSKSIRSPLVNNSIEVRPPSSLALTLTTTLRKQ